MEKYVVFDIDGTLNQTSLYALEAYRKALRKRDIQIEDAKIISCIGLSPAAIIEKLFGSLTDEEHAAWRKDIKHYEFELMKCHAKPFPGMEETLIALKEKGYEMLICSNAYLEHIHHVLNAIGLRKYFDIIGSLEMGQTKAEVLKELLHSLPQGKACMVGDRKFDIEAARSNGIPVIGCDYGYAPEEIVTADRVVSAPWEINKAVEELI